MEKRASLINDMTKGPLLRQLIAFALPVILGNVLQSFYTMVDMVIVGRFIGSDGLAAVGVGGLMQGLLTMSGMGLGFGGQIMLSQQVGARADDRLSKTMGNFFTLTFAIALFFGIAGALLTNPLINVLNTPEAVVAQTKSYYLTCCAGVLFTYGYNAVGAVLRGIGEAKLPTLFIAIATVINIILDYIFVAHVGLNVFGAALATVIAQACAFLFALVCLYRRRADLGFDFKLASLKPNLDICAQILKLAAPLMIFSMLISISSMFINSNVNVYGVVAAAVDGVGSKLTMIASSVTMAFYTSGAAIIGQCFGAGNFERIKRTFRYTTLLSICFWAIVSTFLLLFSRGVFSLFTTDPEVLAIAPKYMIILVVMFFAFSCGTGAFALFEGMGKTNLEMWAGILESLVVKIALAAILAKFLGMYGFWLGNAISAFTTPVWGLIYYKRGRWMNMKTKYADKNTAAHIS